MFAWVHSWVPIGCRDHSGSCGFAPVRLGVVAFIRLLANLSDAPMCRRVALGSRGFTRARLEVVGSIMVRTQARRGIIRFIRVPADSFQRDRCLRAHSGSHRS